MDPAAVIVRTPADRHVRTPGPATVIADVNPGAVRIEVGVGVRERAVEVFAVAAVVTLRAADEPALELVGDHAVIRDQAVDALIVDMRLFAGADARAARRGAYFDRAVEDRH